MQRKRNKKPSEAFMAFDYAKVELRILAHSLTTKPKRMPPDRELCLDIVTRLRESQLEARRPGISDCERRLWLWRARAFDECFTELKGRGFAAKSL